MDALQAKVIADLSSRPDLTENDFYEQHSCDWLHYIRAFLTRLRLPKARKQASFNFKPHEIEPSPNVPLSKPY